MHTFTKLAIFCLFATSLASCDQALNKSASEYLKMSLKDTCGEDLACIAAVNEQFDSCHSKYKEDWDNYINSSSSKEDEFLEIYSTGMYGCIVNEDGNPYFVYDPQ